MIAILAITAVVLAGCARPSYDTVEMKYGNLPAGQGRIYVYQPSSPGDPVTGNPYVLVNGWKAGRTSPGNFFFVDRPAGKYTVTIQYNPSTPLTFDLAAGQTRYVRVNKGGTRLTFNEETKDKAEAEMASMSYHGASSRERRALKRAYPGPDMSPAPQ
ncbi:hypothetical protein BAU07_03370 [Bordetella flabilis]|uniref:DUF2846 domain-containing protein n=2 Tax=Bordetella flabilis TaxID=463014 RepID=A0A193G9X9_9BORD|nr:hypothetical protein BAU07_03370 [Bordetella flabilis]